MSHTIVMKSVKINNIEALKFVCKQIGLQFNKSSILKLYSGTYNINYTIKLPGWKYPIGIKDDGTIIYDNYDGNWGDIKELTKLTKEYMVYEIEEKLMEQGELITKTVDDSNNIHLEYPDGREIIIKDGGEIELEGFHGNGCTSTAEQVANLLGEGEIHDKVDLKEIQHKDVLVEVVS